MTAGAISCMLCGCGWVQLVARGQGTQEVPANVPVFLHLRSLQALLASECQEFLSGKNWEFWFYLSPTDVVLQSLSRMPEVGWQDVANYSKRTTSLMC